MAEDKIAAEERAAVKQLRAAAVDGAARAAARLIAERDDPATDEKLVNRTIAEHRRALSRLLLVLASGLADAFERFLSGLDPSSRGRGRRG